MKYIVWGNVSFTAQPICCFRAVVNYTLESSFHTKITFWHGFNIFHINYQYALPKSPYYICIHTQIPGLMNWNCCIFQNGSRCKPTSCIINKQDPVPWSFTTIVIKSLSHHCHPVVMAFNSNPRTICWFPILIETTHHKMQSFHHISIS